MEETIVNGQIKSRSIYLDDDNYLVIMLRIQEQGYETPYFVRYGSGCDKIYVGMLRSLLQVVGAQSFDDLYGKYVRVKTNGKTGAAGEILAIGNIMDEHWFSFDNFNETE